MNCSVCAAVRSRLWVGEEEEEIEKYFWRTPIARNSLERNIIYDSPQEEDEEDMSIISWSQAEAHKTILLAVLKKRNSHAEITILHYHKWEWFIPFVGLHFLLLHPPSIVSLTFQRPTLMVGHEKQLFQLLFVHCWLWSMTVRKCVPEKCRMCVSHKTGTRHQGITMLMYVDAKADYLIVARE